MDILKSEVSGKWSLCETRQKAISALLNPNFFLVDPVFMDKVWKEAFTTGTLHSVSNTIKMGAVKWFYSPGGHF